MRCAPRFVGSAGRLNADGRHRIFGGRRPATSLDALVTRSSPSFFLWHTAEDEYVPAEHTYLLAASLDAHNVPHAVRVFAHGPHGLGLADGAGGAAAWTDLAASWIGEQSQLAVRR